MYFLEDVCFTYIAVNSFDNSAIKCSLFAFELNNFPTSPRYIYKRLS